MSFKLEDYEPVEERIKRFYSDHPEGRIHTEICDDDGTRIVIKAFIYKTAESVVWSTGYAEEVRGEGFVNKTSAVENCETSAIGRALANANYAGSKRPSREEMEKAQRKPKQPNIGDGLQITAEKTDDKISDPQRRAIFAILREKGFQTEADQRNQILEMIGTDSTSTLTKTEASALIEALNKL